MSEKSERALPCDIEAEAAVLSALMIDSQSVARGMELLTERDFYRNAHRIIFKAISRLFEDNVEVDLITLMHQLETSGNIEKVGGKPYLNELSDIVLSAANLDYHATIIVEKALLRELISASNEIVKQAYAADRPSRDIVDWAEQRIFEIAEIPGRKTFVRASEVLINTKKYIDDAAAMKTNMLGIPSGFSDLDALINGFRKGQLIIVASRPAMGKSSFALNIAAYLAYKRKLKVGIFTLEMANEELMYRLLSSEAEVPMETMMTGYGMDNVKINSIAQVVKEYSDVDLYVDDMGSNTVMSIKAKARRLKAELRGLDLIVIDYLQLMSSGRQGESRQHEISEISRGLKVLAKELEVPVIALSQLNRGLESREDRRPKLSDLRESGAIEQDADLVMFLYRDEYYTKDKCEKPGITEVIIGKNRHGSTGTVELRFISKITKFVSKSDEHSQNF
jgi:replicative DNA helicase